MSEPLSRLSARASGTFATEPEAYVRERRDFTPDSDPVAEPAARVADRADDTFLAESVPDVRLSRPEAVERAEASAPVWRSTHGVPDEPPVSPARGSRGGEYVAEVAEPAARQKAKQDGTDAPSPTWFRVKAGWPNIPELLDLRRKEHANG